MTYLIATITADSPESAAEQIERAIAGGADMIELRLDLMDAVADDEVPGLCQQAAAASVPVILTIRSAGEGGAWDGSDMDRLSRLIALRPAGDYIDIELSSWRRSANLRQKAGLALGRGAADASAMTGGRRMILSRHDPSGRPASLQADLVAMLSEPACDVAKLAWRTRTVRDNFEAFELMRAAPRPIIAICMGDDGLPSRVLAKKFGAFASFASITHAADGLATGGQAEAAPGQLPLEVMRRRYRWDQIDAATRVLGLVGDPVGHSIGPAVHNAVFDAAGENAVYLPFRVAGGYESFKAFMVELLARPWLDVRGLSVTIPHKENALRFLTETGGKIDESARRWGAVNTLTFDEAGRAAGGNTDGPAIRACAEELLDGSLRGRRIAILGAGGAGRAAAAVLVESGGDVTIFNRTADRARQVAAELRCNWARWDDRLIGPFDLAVNCTSLGMARRGGDFALPSDHPAMDPHMSSAIDELLVPADRLRPPLAVLDTVYSPGGTALTRAAHAAGCPVIGGHAVFALQAAGQLSTWLDMPPALAAVQEAVNKALAEPA